MYKLAECPGSSSSSGITSICVDRSLGLEDFRFLLLITTTSSSSAQRYTEMSIRLYLRLRKNG